MKLTDDKEPVQLDLPFDPPLKTPVEDVEEDDDLIDEDDEDIIDEDEDEDDDDFVDDDEDDEVEEDDEDEPEP